MNIYHCLLSLSAKLFFLLDYERSPIKGVQTQKGLVPFFPMPLILYSGLGFELGRGQLFKYF